MDDEFKSNDLLLNPQPYPPTTTNIRPEIRLEVPEVLPPSSSPSSSSSPSCSASTSFSSSISTSKPTDIAIQQPVSNTPRDNTTSAPTSPSNIKNNDSSKGIEGKNEPDSISKEFVLDYEDFDIESYKEYSRNITNEENRDGSTASINISVVGNAQNESKKSDQPIMSSLCKLDKHLSKVADDDGDDADRRKKKQEDDSGSHLAYSKENATKCDQFVRSYVVGKNEIQLETKPPIKVIIEPTSSECSKPMPDLNACNSHQSFQGVSIDGGNSKMPISSSALANSSSPSYLLQQRGSVLFLDPLQPARYKLSCFM